MILAANWKMHMTPAEAREYAQRFLARVNPRPGRELVFFPSAVSLSAAAEAFGGRPDIQVGAQDVHWEPKGAFTGAISVSLIEAAGATAALVGHSERRHVFGETDEDTQRKVRALLEHGLTPFLCVGETLKQRERGETADVVLRQLDAACRGLSGDEALQLVIAYEPVWAIGTGKVASPQQAEEVHADLRSLLAKRYNQGIADSVRILYGGSVKASNAAELLGQPNIDGALVGGASLKVEEFLGIAGAA
jgi:triosephosphate isomerase